MGIFDFLFEGKSTLDSYHVKDERKAECPYCRKVLNKIPSKKTKCPSCEKFMFVRNNTQNYIRSVVTEEKAEKIDEDWSIVNGTHDIFIAEKRKIEKEKEILKKKFGKEPLGSDVQWSILNKSLIEDAQHRNLGFYRNTRFEMAEILRKELKLENALQTYLEVCCLDLNGPNNRGGMNDAELLKEFPVFDSEMSFLAPAVINRIRSIVKKLKFDKNKVKSIFIAHNLKIKKSLKLPLSVENCWQSIDDELIDIM